jgi:hypothetical protein
MKKAILVLFPIIALIGIFYYMQKSNVNPSEIDNTKRVPLEVKDNVVQDPQCHMFIVGKEHTVQVITKDNKTHFFDDPGCAVLWMNEQKIDLKDTTVWFYTQDTKRWKKLEDVVFSISDDTPMDYGFGAYENKKSGMIDFDEMSLKMLRGENMTNPKIRKKILSNQRGY